MSTDRRRQGKRREEREQEEGVGVSRGFGNNVQGCSVQGKEAESRGSRRGDRSLVKMPRERKAHEVWPWSQGSGEG